MTPSRRARLLALISAAALAALAAPSTAGAQGWTCEATAFAGSLLTSPREAPISANRGQPACRTQQAGANSPPGMPLPVVLTALSAQTRLDGPEGRPEQQTAFAAGGIADLRVLSLPDLPISLPTPSFDEFQAVRVPLPAGDIVVDLRPALQALLGERQLPHADLVRVRVARAEVTGRCENGAPRLTGTSAVSGVAINGVDIGLDRAVSRTVQLLDSRGIDPSNVDISQIVGPPGVDLTALQALIQPVLDGLPTIAIPATVARIRVAPGTRTETPTQLTQRALEVEVAIGGQNVADIDVGEATVGANQVRCGGVAELALQCTKRRIVLIDVLRRGGRVRLFGATSREFAGEQVEIRFTATGDTVARATVGSDGLFRASARMPRRSIRRTNRARYQAEIHRQRSFRLKLVRRMLVGRTTVRGSRVTIAGRVVRPLGRPVQEIIVQRRLSCGRYEEVGRVRPSRDGRFRVTVPGPVGNQAAAYRLRTRVRKNTRNRKLFPTFTLPRYVDLT